jgi:hypothetical protein
MPAEAEAGNEAFAAKPPLHQKNSFDFRIHLEARLPDFSRYNLPEKGKNIANAHKIYQTAVK